MRLNPLIALFLRDLFTGTWRLVADLWGQRQQEILNFKIINVLILIQVQ